MRRSPGPGLTPVLQLSSTCLPDPGAKSRPQRVLVGLLLVVVLSLKQAHQVDAHLGRRAGKAIQLCCCRVATKGGPLGQSNILCQCRGRRAPKHPAQRCAHPAGDVGPRRKGLLRPVGEAVIAIVLRQTVWEGEASPIKTTCSSSLLNPSPSSFCTSMSARAKGILKARLCAWVAGTAAAPLHWQGALGACLPLCSDRGDPLTS